MSLGGNPGKMASRLDASLRDDKFPVLDAASERHNSDMQQAHLEQAVSRPLIFHNGHF